MSDERAVGIAPDAALDGRCLLVPAPVLVATAKLLRSYGRGRHEGVVFWGGVEDGTRSVVLSAFSPTAVTTWGSFRTDTAANTALTLALARQGLALVGQVHSHPGRGVDHSHGDDEGAVVRFEGFWSVVVPDYAKAGVSLSDCGVHLFCAGAFHRLTPEAVARRVLVVPVSEDLRGQP